MHSCCGLKHLALASSRELSCPLWSAGQCVAGQATFTGVPCVPQTQRSARHHSARHGRSVGAAVASYAHMGLLSARIAVSSAWGHLCVPPLGCGAFPLVSLLVAPGSCPPGGTPQLTVPLPSSLWLTSQGRHSLARIISRTQPQQITVVGPGVESTDCPDWVTAHPLSGGGVVGLREPHLVRVGGSPRELGCWDTQEG